MYNQFQICFLRISATLNIRFSIYHLLGFQSNSCLNITSTIQFKQSRIYRPFGGNMLLKSKFFRLIASFTLILSLCLLAFADTIRLKDGSIVKGRVIGFKDGQFVIVIGEGSRQRQMSFYADEIESIEFDSKNTIPTTTVAQNNPTTSQPRPTPTPVASNNPPTNSNPNVRIAGTQTETEKQSTTENVPVSNPQKNPSKNSGVQINAKVLADNTANGWTNTGWVVKKGQRIRISGTGRVSLVNGRYSTPSGVSSLPDGEKLMKEKPTGSLIAVIGDDNNEFIFVGGSSEFVATRDGTLFLGVNEGYLDDNSGSFDVVIEVDPLTGDVN
jgi:hypothetical protein